jgi:opacity protein-like surface antigen
VKMKRWAWFVAVILAIAFARPAMAQSDNPKVEAFVGYSLVHVSVNTTGAVPGMDIDPSGAPASYGFNFNGGSGQLAYNVTPMIGVVADFGGYSCSCTSNGVTVNTNVISYLFGPRFSYRRSGSKLVPFGQVLFGGARLANAITLPTVDDNQFALTVGGGVDYNLTQHIAIRPIQAEYFMTKFNDGDNNRQNNFRYSAGVVIQF